MVRNSYDTLHYTNISVLKVSYSVARAVKPICDICVFRLYARCITCVVSCDALKL